MPVKLRSLTTRDGLCALVQLTGAIESDKATLLADALLAWLADHPGPIVVDVSELTDTDRPTACHVFSTVRQRVADWPGAGLLLVDPDIAAADVWSAAGIPVWPSWAEALVAASAAPWLSVELDPVVSAARQARKLVSTGCARWQVPELADPGSIALTEMVNNAVVHARTPMSVRLSLQNAVLHLGVRDHCPHGPASPKPASPKATGGRGLLLIDDVTRRWGATLVPDGKMVWAVVDAADDSGKPKVGD